MENLYLNKNLNDEDIINLSFSLGKVYDKLKEFDKAFLYFSKGNRLKRKYINYDFKDIEILNDNLGKPYFNINDKLKKILKRLTKINSFNFFLSLSDEKSYSVAFVTIQTK